MDGMAEFLLKTLGITREQQALLIRTAWVVFVSAHVAWVCGLLAFAGLDSPFARADALKEMQQTVTQDRIDRLDKEILDLRGKQCKATTDEAKSLYGSRMKELADKFEALSHREARIPRCDEL